MDSGRRTLRGGKKSPGKGIRVASILKGFSGCRPFDQHLDFPLCGRLRSPSGLSPRKAPDPAWSGGGVQRRSEVGAGLRSRMPRCRCRRCGTAQPGPWWGRPAWSLVGPVPMGDARYWLLLGLGASPAHPSRTTPATALGSYLRGPDSSSPSSQTPRNKGIPTVTMAARL